MTNNAFMEEGVDNTTLFQSNMMCKQKMKEETSKRTNTQCNVEFVPNYHDVAFGRREQINSFALQPQHNT